MKVGIDYIGVTVTFYCNDGKGNWLLHKRSQNCRDERGVWDVGGGKLEFGETVEEGLMREIYEEYGCKAVIQTQLPSLGRIRNHEGVKTHWISLGFILKVNPKTVKNNDPKAIDEIGWFKIDNLPSPLHSTIPIRLTEQFEYFQPYM